jgi:hypothetical protein
MASASALTENLRHCLAMFSWSSSNICAFVSMRIAKTVFIECTNAFLMATSFIVNSLACLSSCVSAWPHCL